MPDRETKRSNAALAFIRKQIQILNWLTVLTVFVLLLIIIRLSYDVLDYMSTWSLMGIIALTACLSAVSIYLTKMVTSKATSAIDDYSGKLNAMLSIINDIRQVGYIGILLKNIVKEAVNKTQADGGSILLEDGDNLVLKAFVGYDGRGLEGFSIPKSRGILGWVVKNDKAVIINNIKESTIFTPGIDDRVGYERGSVICVPLRRGPKSVGILKVDSMEVGSFSAEDEEMLLHYAEHAVLSIEKTKNYEEKDSYGVHLTDILIEAVENLSGKRLT